ATENFDVDSSAGTSSANSTVSLTTALTVSLTDAPVSPIDSPADPPADPPTDHPSEDTTVSLKQVVQLPLKKAKESDFQVQMQDIRGDTAHIIKLLKASNAKLETMGMLQEEMEKLQKEMKNIKIQHHEEVKNMHKEGMGQLAVLQSRVQAVLTQTFELHEYQIPRLFIVLPQSPKGLDVLNPLTNEFRIYFLCDCGEHTRLANSKTKIPHHIHLAQHEGYEIKRHPEFVRQYGSYLLAILKMLQIGFMVAGVVVPALSHIISPDVIGQSTDSLKKLQVNIASRVDQAIEWIKVTSEEGEAVEENSMRRGGAVEQMETMEALEGADLRELSAFLKDNDGNKALGNLYRTVTIEGHVKW
ncbi:hypothetical protein BGZ98_003564, partial [Dissophora globulifera]